MYVDFLAFCVAAAAAAAAAAVAVAVDEDGDAVDTAFDGDWCWFVKYLTKCKFIAAGVLFVHNSSAPVLLILSNDIDLLLLAPD